jgi:CBS domain-containing protein
MGPRALGAPLHRHTREDEFSYVLEGRVGTLLGDDVVYANPGDLVCKPRGQWHAFWNAGDDPARILEIISPAGFEQFFAALMDLGGVAAHIPVRAHMQYAPLTGRPEDLVSQAHHRMQKADVRHLPIVAADGTLVGLLSDRDLRQASASTLPPLSRYEAPLQLMTLLVKDIMRTDVTTVGGETALADAGQLLLEHKIGCLPVLHHGRTLVGIVTVTDLLRAYVAVQHSGRATPE